ncbi:hypothetical protein CEUSTIGMA_g9459.t1 [Chlamydomonas eustigma]|uniref:GHMP kinase N-terminal domain-containing protein n=1 Tax=Chlamydomonas eustigma TaxID=1157962 RepID=A0A250XG31_9CHLO|nr:hypothetical protein CEUSTIGMA_g9459.t1 [Chlamydomonas eustigma]|eukprot:GAX82031.1 hypothetical protein CEUSTIGMA_g9459.t1 [Chlamydomonas eustigma]
MSITERVYARVGLLGNPSDGYFGCCISFSLMNFWAEVELTPQARGIQFIPSPVHDLLSFPSLNEFNAKISGCGYYGGVRLLQAMVKVFHQYCREMNISVSTEKTGFQLSYSTNIPRQTGLSGSSAICCAALNALMKHFGVEHQIPLEMRPNLVLGAEKELGITAGLQDRVIQVYGGLMYMDFDESHMRMKGHGMYERMDPNLLSLQGNPALLYIMFADCPSESGAVHADVRQRWLRGDEEIREGMLQLASIAKEGRVALEQRNIALLAELMSRNFDLRRSMFGDEVLGEQNLDMIMLARSHGCAAKFTGSGGAVVVLCTEGEAQAAALRLEAANRGYCLQNAHFSRNS